MASPNDVWEVDVEPPHYEPKLRRPLTHTGFENVPSPRLAVYRALSRHIANEMANVCYNGKGYLFADNMRTYSMECILTTVKNYTSDVIFGSDCFQPDISDSIDEISMYVIEDLYSVGEMPLKPNALYEFAGKYLKWSLEGFDD
jgi:hypothetical protein